MTNTELWAKVPELYLLCRAAGVQRLQVSFPGRNGNRVLISCITTPHTLHAEHTRPKNNRVKTRNPPDRGRVRVKKKKENEEVEEQKRIQKTNWLVNQKKKVQPAYSCITHLVDGQRSGMIHACGGAGGAHSAAMWRPAWCCWWSKNATQPESTCEDEDEGRKQEMGNIK